MMNRTAVEGKTIWISTSPMLRLAKPPSARCMASTLPGGPLPYPYLKSAQPSHLESLFMTYREPLPEGCPPDSAEEITVTRKVFRLIRTVPPTDDDFRSQREETRSVTTAEYPSAKCVACQSTQIAPILNVC